MNKLITNYIDPYFIAGLTMAEPNDTMLGSELRKYIDECKKRMVNDELFPTNSKISKYVTCPSHLDKRIKDLLNTNEDDEE